MGILFGRDNCEKEAAELGAWAKEATDEMVKLIGNDASDEDYKDAHAQVMTRLNKLLNEEADHLLNTARSGSPDDERLRMALGGLYLRVANLAQEVKQIARKTPK